MVGAAAAPARLDVGAARAGLLGRWAVDTYDPEVERFGGPGPLRAAERVFHADSVLALEMLGAGPVDPADAALSVLDVLRHVATATTA